MFELNLSKMSKSTRLGLEEKPGKIYTHNFRITDQDSDIVISIWRILGNNLLTCPFSLLQFEENSHR